MRIIVFLFSLFLSLAACAQDTPESDSSSAPTFTAGEHYDVIEIPVKTITPGKIEVTEVFWYGCGHCFSFEPIINSWAENLPDDVELVKSPAIWRSNMEAHARIFYTAKALGVMKEVHPKVFEAIHHKRMSLTDDEEVREFFTKFGVEPEKFESVYKSFSVSSQVQQAGARARSFLITGTPEIVVDGRFRISAKKAGGQNEMLDVVDFLVKQIREKKI